MTDLPDAPDGGPIRASSDEVSPTDPAAPLPGRGRLPYLARPTEPSLPVPPGVALVEALLPQVTGRGGAASGGPAGRGAPVGPTSPAASARFGGSGLPGEPTRPAGPAGTGVQEEPDGSSNPSRSGEVERIGARLLAELPKATPAERADLLEAVAALPDDELGRLAVTDGAAGPGAAGPGAAGPDGGDGAGTEADPLPAAVVSALLRCGRAEHAAQLAEVVVRDHVVHFGTGDERVTRAVAQLVVAHRQLDGAALDAMEDRAVAALQAATAALGREHPLTRDAARHLDRIRSARARRRAFDGGAG